MFLLPVIVVISRFAWMPILFYDFANYLKMSENNEQTLNRLW